MSTVYNEVALDTLPIMEIFSSIQGEGQFMGSSVTFVRVLGCNLSCPFCDTKESWKLFSERQEAMMSVQDVVDKILDLGQFRVVFTGGEPCLYKSQLETIARLLQIADKRFHFALETNGTLPTPLFFNWITVSPKPQADYAIHNECFPDELKYVISKEFSEEFKTKDLIPEDLRTRFDRHIWLQPEGYHMEESFKECYKMAMADPRLRVGIQLHKIMEVK